MGKTVGYYFRMYKKLNEKLYKNKEVCRKFHSTPCLSLEK